MLGFFVTMVMLFMVTPIAGAEDVHHPSGVGAAAFAEGKKLVEEGKDGRLAFRRAAEAFQRQLDEDGPSAGRYLNLANTAFLADDLPRSLRAFHAGLALDPHHALLRENLTYARAQIVHPPGQGSRPEADFWPWWLPRLSALTWVVLGTTFYTLAWIALTCWWLRGPGFAGAWFSAFLLGAVLACIAGYGWFLLHEQRKRDREFPVAVIELDDVALRMGNGVGYPRHAELPTLRRGMEARRIHTRGGWAQIQFASGEVGWVPIGAACGLALTPNVRRER